MHDDLLPFTNQHQGLGAIVPRAIFIGEDQLDNIILRIIADLTMISCRKITGYVAVRICDPTARHPSPLNSRRPATEPPGTARGRHRSASSLAVRGERYSHSQHQAKLADIRLTAARIAQAGEPERPEARCGNIGPLRPPVTRWQIFPSGSLPLVQSPGSAGTALLF